jgi:DNA-binding transcriptional MerR regulator
MEVRDTRPLTISEFGRRAGLSIKALRLYDMSGLLPPARVDPVSGYRHYTADQLDRARRISELRRLDMPLAVVAEVLAGTDEQAVQRLDSWWAGQESAMQAYEAVELDLSRSGSVPAGPWRELYLALWCDVRATDPFVHVARPFA